MISIDDFRSKFDFKPRIAGQVGLERECFILDDQGMIVPNSVQVLSHLASNGHGQFGYELSACQLEERVGPCSLSKLADGIHHNNRILQQAESEIGFGRMFCPVAPTDMPLDIYPDPSGRYQKITQNMPREILLAACRIIGIHIHIGMPDHNTALKVYNHVVDHCSYLNRLGNEAGNVRLDVYKVVAPNFMPPAYQNWQVYYGAAVAGGFASDPRSCWHLIRISVHGTIEFRMFSSTDNIDQIVSWVNVCHSLCQAAIYH